MAAQAATMIVDLPRVRVRRSELPQGRTLLEIFTRFIAQRCAIYVFSPHAPRIAPSAVSALWLIVSLRLT